MQRMIKDSGKVITIHKIHKNQGTFEGNPCDLLEYRDENNVKRLIEAPLVDL